MSGKLAPAPITSADTNLISAQSGPRELFFFSHANSHVASVAAPSKNKKGSRVRAKTPNQGIK